MPLRGSVPDTDRSARRAKAPARRGFRKEREGDPEADRRRHAASDRARADTNSEAGTEDDIRPRAGWGLHADSSPMNGPNMKQPLVQVVGLLAILGATNAAAQSRNFDSEINAALESAKTAAGFEFTGTLARICLLPQSGGEDTSDSLPVYIADPSQVPARETWYAEPARVFDNLYFVGGKIHSSWALTTRDGIILFDTIYPYNSEELIVGGMKKLGLDPKNIKYVLISHAHGDHIGGAEILQSRYGARVVMGGPDWDWVAKYPNRYKTMAPKRDIVATDGMKIALGESTVTIWLTPGHTPGTLS